MTRFEDALKKLMLLNAVVVQKIYMFIIVQTKFSRIFDSDWSVVALGSQDFLYNGC